MIHCVIILRAFPRAYHFQSLHVGPGGHARPNFSFGRNRAEENKTKA
jgi:hypothetical protein